MNGGLLKGKLVRLTADNPEVLGAAFSRWDRDSEYSRPLRISGEPLWSTKKFKDWIEKNAVSDSSHEAFFNIHVLEGDLLIGFAGLWGIAWTHGDAWVTIAIGEREYWGRGFGTEAMNLILGYAFQEFNIQRVTLGVFNYNTRAQRSYERAGFRVEGCQRGGMLRDGHRRDILHMGILRSEWEALNGIKA